MFTIQAEDVLSLRLKLNGFKLTYSFVGMYFPAERSMPVNLRTKNVASETPSPFSHFLFHPLFALSAAPQNGVYPHFPVFSGTSQPLSFAHAAIGQRWKFGSLKKWPILWQSVILTNPCISSENGDRCPDPSTPLRPTRLLCARLSWLLDYSYHWLFVP